MSKFWASANEEILDGAIGTSHAALRLIRKAREIGPCELTVGYVEEAAQLTNAAILMLKQVDFDEMSDED